MTIYDIAEIAGVSGSTVSRVINGRSGISEKTRIKVQKLLDEYGYTPNEAARGLVNKETKLIGILILDIRYAYHVEIAYNIQEAMIKENYCCIIINTGSSDEKKVEGLRLMKKRRVDGLVLVGSTFQCDSVEKEIRDSLSDIPIVMTNGYLPLPNIHGILLNEKDGIRSCVHTMQNRGHKKLAFVLPNDTPSNLSKQEGFQLEMEQYGWPRSDHWLYEAPTSVEDGYRIVQEILEDHPDLEGIVFGEDLCAVGGLRALLDCGKKIPEQVSVIGVDDSIYCEVSYPKLSSLNNCMEELSCETSRILIDTLQGKKNPKRIMMYCELHERETT